ncbi:MAG: GDP-mannose 4,6 dehydratase, partial [Chloroflexota bacterium]|nr:GDP-mannose 4,6 dehydratase [Chloroflexota bacterium]
NIGSGQGRQMADVLEILAGLSRVEFHIRADASRMRPLDVPLLICDAGRLTTLTGWTPAIRLEETLADLLDYWRGKTSADHLGTAPTAVT